MSLLRMYTVLYSMTDFDFEQGVYPFAKRCRSVISCSQLVLGYLDSDQPIAAITDPKIERRLKIEY